MVALHHERPHRSFRQIHRRTRFDSSAVHRLFMDSAVVDRPASLRHELLVAEAAEDLHPTDIAKLLSATLLLVLPRRPLGRRPPSALYCRVLRLPFPGGVLKALELYPGSADSPDTNGQNGNSERPESHARPRPGTMRVILVAIFLAPGGEWTGPPAGRCFGATASPALESLPRGRRIKMQQRRQSREAVDSCSGGTLVNTQTA